MRGVREMTDIAGESNGYTRWRRETRNNLTSQFGPLAQAGGPTCSTQVREYTRRQQGKKWDATEHKMHMEYQTLISDLVLESEYLG
jgi:hypothetical protein